MRLKAIRCPTPLGGPRGQGIAPAGAAQDVGEADGEQRARAAARRGRPRSAQKSPSTRSGAKERAGFIEAPVIGLDQRPARMM